jgi:hypothetical protein
VRQAEHAVVDRKLDDDARMHLATLHLIAVPLGSTLALIVALGVSVAWNAAIYATRRGQSRG